MDHSDISVESIDSVSNVLNNAKPNIIFNTAAFHNVPICEGDGPTECSPVTSINPIYGKRKPGSIGKVIPDVQMKIVDQDGNDMPVGEIVVRSENVMKGYFKMLVETTDSFVEE